MTAPALLKKADLKRMATIAKSEGVTVWIEINGQRVGISPDAAEDRQKEGLASRPVIRL